MILQRIDRVGGSFGGGAEDFVARRLAVERGFGVRDAARARFGAADADTRVGDLSVLQAIGDQRRGQREIAGAAVEFVEAEFGVGRE